MTDHPAVAYLRIAHNRAEQLAREAADETGLEWTDGGKHGESVSVVDSNDTVAVGPWSGYLGDGTRGLIALNAPASVLRRVVAERELLVEHATDLWSRCTVCSEEDYDGAERAFRRSLDWPCPTILAVARGWGWTEEGADV